MPRVTSDRVRIFLTPEISLNQPPANTVKKAPPKRQDVIDPTCALDNPISSCMKGYRAARPKIDQADANWLNKTKTTTSPI